MHAAKPGLRPSVMTAIEEQQTKVWRLRSLLDVLREAIREDHGVEDAGAAIDALVEYADQIHMALDVDTIKARAAELEDEKRQKAEREARYIENERQAPRREALGPDGEQSPDDGPTGTVQ